MNECYPLPLSCSNKFPLPLPTRIKILKGSRHMKANHNHIAREINVNYLIWSFYTNGNLPWHNSLREQSVMLNRGQGSDLHLIKCGVKYKSLSKLMDQKM